MRKKKTNLTVKEKRLVEYPPTPTTWICACGIYNSGSKTKCAFCGHTKTKKLLWPTYVAACEKLGIEPGTHVRFHKDIHRPMVFTGSHYRFLDDERENDHPAIKKIVRKKNG